MATVVDVAAYILNRSKPLSTMKLQKLTFYSQAHALATAGTPLFQEDFEAWRGGPVSAELFEKHQGLFIIESGQLQSDSNNLSDKEKQIIDVVFDQLGNLTGNELSERTHAEAPWSNARKGLNPSDPSNNVISQESIREYYMKNPVVSR